MVWSLDDGSGEFFWVLSFKNLYFLGTGHSCCIFRLLKKCCIFKCYIFSKVFFWVQFFLPSTSVNTVLHYYHIVLNFYQMKHVLGGYFLGFCFFSRYQFWGFVSVTKYFLGRLEISNFADPC